MTKTDGVAGLTAEERIKRAQKKQRDRQAKDRISQIASLLGCDHAEMKADASSALSAMERVRLTPTQPKQRKAAAKVVAVALRKINTALPQLWDSGLAVTDFAHELQHWEAEAKAVAYGTLPQPSKRSDRDVAQRRKRLAVERAARLMSKYGGDLGETKTLKALAVCLYGDPSVKLGHVVRRFQSRD